MCTHCWCFPEERVPCLVADDEHLGETPVMLPVSTVHCDPAEYLQGLHALPGFPRGANALPGC